MSDIQHNTRTGLEIAVIGVAGRFPRAKNIDEFWHNIKNGVETVTYYSEEDLKEVGYNLRSLENPNFIRAVSVLEGVEYFDAAFFNYAPSEAESLDPQMRLLHECVWEALEDAGYVPDSEKLSIGLYAGAVPSFQWEIVTFLSNQASDLAGGFAKSILNNKDLITTRISYNLDLSGPSITLYTACSTSLVAIDQASRSLLTGQCDIVLAGGITAYYPPRKGYVYQEGMILSPDGHTRAFDKEGKGSLFGEGMGIVALKMLDEAIRDKDNIYAIIIGTASNNDGAQKVGYAAPSVKGQAAVIKAAQRMARIEPESISYIEAHGTGTPLGDPVEIKALKNAFNTEKKKFCAMGTLKTLMGHLDVAAGVASFIKTVLMLKHRVIPPTLHFEVPNPEIDFENSPFYVVTRLMEWKNDKYPLRAGIDGFGVGGGNAHIILEEAPRGINQDETAAHLSSTRENQLLLFSAKTATALETMTTNLARYMEKNPNIPLADAAYTLQVGRKAFPYRRRLVCSGREEAIEFLSAPEGGKAKTHRLERSCRSVVFMFAGLGAQYVNMGRDLYEREPVFRREMELCFEILKNLLEYDIKDILYPPESPDMSLMSQAAASTTNRINQPEISQLVIFIFEIALAGLLIHWGIKPRAMIGYSFGEYAAAYKAGVFSLEDALKLVVKRGQLMQTVEEGVMLSIPLPAVEVEPLLNPSLSLSIDNGPSSIVSGEPGVVEAFEQEMKKKKLLCMRVPANRAVHSHMMTPILEQYTAFVSTITCQKPKIPYISNVTGTWIRDEEAVDPRHWANHLHKTVRYAEGMKELLKDPQTLFIEIGPGRDISTLALRHIEADPNGGHRVINLVRQPHQQYSDVYLLLNKIGEMWLYGLSIDWERFYDGEERRRVSLPPYPFERQRYWVDEKALQAAPATTGAAPSADYADWFYIPTWTRSKTLPRMSMQQNSQNSWNGHWLIFLMEGKRLPTLMRQRLEHWGHEVIIVKPGEQFIKENPKAYQINPKQLRDYEQLFKELGTRDPVPNRILHTWTLTEEQEPGHNLEDFYALQELGYYSLIHIAKAIGKENIVQQFRLVVIIDRLQEVIGEEPLCAIKAPIQSPLMVIPQEYPNIRCQSIDVIPPPPRTIQEETLVDNILQEAAVETTDTVVAYRGNYRWEEIFERHRLEKPVEDTIPKVRENGVYLLTGGMGTIGLILAETLARKAHAKLILTGRTPLPPKDEWTSWLEEHKNQEDAVTKKIKALSKIEALGAELLVYSVDTVDKEKMQRVITEAEQTFGPINGVIHLAGIVKGETFSLIRNIERRHCLEQFRPKVDGILILEELLEGKELDFCWLMSSLSIVLGGLGFVAYAGANIFLDALVKQHNRTHSLKWFSVDWEDEQRDETEKGFQRILTLENVQQVVFCRGGTLHERIDQWIKLETMQDEEKEEEAGLKSRQPRPDLLNPYFPPAADTEKTLAKIWENLLGFESLGVEDDFLELGGDSLKAITMITRVHKELHVSIPLTEFFAKPTIRHLSEFIGGAEEEMFVTIEPAEKKQYYPLSSAQKRIYILQQMEGDTVSYNETNIKALSGEISRRELETICRKLIRRHESLRTSFIIVNDEPAQRVHDYTDIEFAIEYHDLTAEKPAGTGSVEGLNAIIKNFVRPFDFSKAPLLRVGIIKKGAGEQTLMVDMHHIITDDASILVFLADMHAIVQGKELPPLRIQYKEYSQWQNNPRQKQTIQKQEEYWLKQFERPAPRLNLPLDHERSLSYAAVGYLNAQLEDSVAEKLQALARETEVTMFMVYLTIYTIFLGKITGEEDIVVGTLTAGRSHTDLEEVIGMFVNTLVLRNFPRQEQTFFKFLEEVKKHTLEAFENQDYQFDDLVDKVVKTRETGRNPIFDNAFAYYAEHRELPGKIPAKGEITKGTIQVQAKFDFTLNVTDKKDGLYISLNYNANLFNAETIERYFYYIHEICETVAENSAIKIAEITVSHQLAEAQSTVIEAEQGDFGF